MLMLIDTPDPRYRPDEPEPEPGRRRWNPRLRVLLPLVGAILCIAIAYLVPPLVAYVLMVVGLVLFFDAATSLYPSGGGMTDHRQ
jgi:hypothetical protein